MILWRLNTESLNLITLGSAYFSTKSICFLCVVHLFIIQFSSVAQSCPTLCDPMNCNTPGLPVHHQLPESTQTHVHRVGDAIQPSHPLSSPLASCPSIPPSIRVFSNESTLHMRWPKYWSFSYSIIPSKVYPGLISFRMDWYLSLAFIKMNILNYCLFYLSFLFVFE